MQFVQVVEPLALDNTSVKFIFATQSWQHYNLDDARDDHGGFLE